MRYLIVVFFIFLWSGCRKKPDDPVLEPHYVRMKINGATIFNWTDDNSLNTLYGAARYNDWVQLPSSNCLANICFEVKRGSEIILLSTENTVPFKNRLRIYYTQSARNEANWMYEDWNRIGLIPYGKDRNVDTDPVANGIVIVYIDENGKLWKSDKGLQTGSFLVLENKPDGNGRVWKALFSARLYNGTESLTIQEGELYLPYGT